MSNLHDGKYIIIGKSQSDKKDNNNHKISGQETAGIILGNVSSSSVTYGMDKFNTLRGHGFAAERANHLFDKVTGKNATILGDDNAKHGADRLVNGVEIQSKYCATGSKCINECFENGTFKYLSADGSPMLIEVPYDKYDAAVQSMENKIRKGQVPGITDPNEAKNIVKRGRFTYEQAKNIAKFGTVESITYDAVNGAIIASSAMGITAMLTFATSIWSGENYEVALKHATYAGLKVGGVSFVTTVLSSQLARTGLNSALRGSTDYIVKTIGPKACAQIANAFRSGKNIYGAAAMNNVSKMLRGNVISGVLSITILSTFDISNLFRGRISGKQLFKNITKTTSSVAGGTAGWIGGAAAGATVGSFIPVIGTTIGGIIGGVSGALSGGTMASKASNKVLDAFIEDDANEMVKIMEEAFTELALQYLLNQNEAEDILDALQEDLSAKLLKDMFASNDRKSFARKLLITHIETVVQEREYIKMPKDNEVISSLRDILEAAEAH